MTRGLDHALDQRVLVFAPVGKDAPLAMDVLRRTDLRWMRLRDGA